MDKAIVELQKYKNILLNEAAVGGYISDTKSIDEAITELTAHKARIEKLKEWCKYHSRDTPATKYDRYWKGYQKSAIFILQKLMAKNEK